MVVCPIHRRYLKHLLMRNEFMIYFIYSKSQMPMQMHLQHIIIQYFFPFLSPFLLSSSFAFSLSKLLKPKNTVLTALSILCSFPLGSSVNQLEILEGPIMSGNLSITPPWLLIFHLFYLCMGRFL